MYVVCLVVVDCLVSRSMLLHLYGDITITAEGPQNLDHAGRLQPLSRERKNY